MHLAFIILNAPLNGADPDVMRLGSMLSHNDSSFLLEVSDEILFIRRHSDQRLFVYANCLTVGVKEYISISLRACPGFGFSWHAYYY